VGVTSQNFSLHLSLEDRPNKVKKLVNIHFMQISSPDCSTCLFSWYWLVIMVGGVGGYFSQTRSIQRKSEKYMINYNPLPYWAKKIWWTLVH